MRDEEPPPRSTSPSTSNDDNPRVLGLSVEQPSSAVGDAEPEPSAEETAASTVLTVEGREAADSGRHDNSRTFKFKRRPPHFDGDGDDDESFGASETLTSTAHQESPSLETAMTHRDFELPSSETQVVSVATGQQAHDPLPPPSPQQTRPTMSRRKDKRLISELSRLPSQRFWQQPVTVSEPKSVVRRARLWCGRIVDHPTVQVSIILLIIVNSILMGVATFPFVTDNPRAVDGFETTDTIFLIIFTIELALQFCYRFLALFKDGWLVFDFAIVVSSWSLESLQVIRAFRSFRALRLVTRIGPLRDLIAAIGAVMPRMYAIALLLLLVFYIFAVLFTELFGELVLAENYFTTLDASLFTCMVLMTLQWADVTRQVMEQLPWAWAPIIAFIAITGFIVFNLIVAVVCDAVAVVDREARAAEEKRQNGERVSDKDILVVAQTRIWELNGDVQAMKRRQSAMQQLLHDLTSEIAVLQASSELDDDGHDDNEDPGDDLGSEPVFWSCSSAESDPVLSEVSDPFRKVSDHSRKEVSAIPDGGIAADAAPGNSTNTFAGATGTSDAVLSKPTRLGFPVSDHPQPKVSAWLTKRKVSFDESTAAFL